MVTISSLISAGAEKLTGIAENPRSEARILLAHALSMEITDIIVHAEKEVSDDKIRLFDSFVRMRTGRKPISYITGKKEFFGLSFRVNEHTLIPRPETELVVEEIISSGKKRLLDLCTGSGCIPVAATKNADITALGIDISTGAVETARQNALENNLDDKVTFEVADIFKKDFFGKFDIISSNPPYITEHDMTLLPPDVANYEPLSALAGGVDGLDFYRRIIEIAPLNLAPDGMLVFEVGIGESEAVKELMEKDFTDIKIKKDLAGIDRVVTGRVK